MSTGTPTAGALKIPLAALDTGGGVVSLANPEGVDLIVTDLIIDVTTAATAACTLDAGIAAAATTLADTLIDGLDVNAAVGTFDNRVNAGTNGGMDKWGADEFLTISMASGAAAGVAGYAYVKYVHE